MRYVIVGAGAVGGTLGAALHFAGRDVTLIARGQHYEGLRDHGLRFETANGTLVADIPVAEHPREISYAEGDVALLCVKAHQTDQAIRDLKTAAPESLRVVCAQNGVANEPRALRSFPEVYGMRVNAPTSHLEPGVVTAHGSPVYGIVDIGRFPDGHDRFAEHFAVTLNEAGFLAQCVSRIMRWKYYKLLVNLRNAIDTCCGPGAPGTDELYELAVSEGHACLAAAEIDVATDEEERAQREAFGLSQPLGGPAYPGNSSWQSVVRGQETEVDYLNGEIVLLGRCNGIPVPVNTRLQEEMHRLVNSRGVPGQLSPSALMSSQRLSRKLT